MQSKGHTVVPRGNGYKHLPILAVDERTGETLNEEGTIGLFSQFLADLPLTEQCIIVTCHSAWMLAVMQERWERSPGWISKTTRRERALYVPGTSKYGVTLGIANAVPHFCGWRRGSDARHCSFRKYTYFLDPDLFYASEKVVQDVFGTPRDFTLRKLLDWSLAVRKFCQENHVPVNQTQGALGAKFLTDPRFYPEPRRKVPKATNDRLRKYLPCNHSTVAVSPGGDRTFDGHYLDQRRAHHYHARTTRLPSSNSLFAYGDFARLQQVSLNPDGFLNGEFCGVVTGNFTPPKRGTTFLPPRWRRRTVSRRMVSTAEWPWLSDIGVECLGLLAAWGSVEVDTGIARYAEHAESELDLWTDRPLGADWLKPVLVSTYGALAVNTETQFETLVGGRAPEGKERTTWDAGTKALHGYLLDHTEGNKLEPGTTNVLHRCLIEAATRTESLAFANHLVRTGYRVLMIHVDAVVVEYDESKPLPQLFEPWRYKSKLTELAFYDDWSFESREMTRMPGRPHLKSRHFVKVRPPQFEYEPDLLPAYPEP